MLSRDEEQFLTAVLQKYRRYVQVNGTMESNMSNLAVATADAMSAAIAAELEKVGPQPFRNACVAVAACALTLYRVGDIRYPGTRDEPV